jgi:KDO2-lipid IV(A) lauroyltransferase
MSDYLAYILFKIVASFARLLPPEFSLFLGRRLGDALYYLDAKHRAVAYANIRSAFGTGLLAAEACRLTRKFYRNFGQSLIEIFFIPFADKKYFEKYVTVEGRQHIEEAFKKKRGVILLGAHAGSWELSNVICANLGFAFNLLVRDQKKFPRLERLLNSYRSSKGCKLIQRQNQTRELIEALKRNEAVGMTVDQGGKSGSLVNFFGRPASMATGAIRLALKYDSVILPAYYTRIRGPYIKTVFEEPFEVERDTGEEEDIQRNLERLAPIFEKNIRNFPADYLWTYKIWKHAQDKRILILSDGKAGHLRQAQGCAQLAQSAFHDAGMRAEIETAEVNFKNDFAKSAMTLGSCLAGRYGCQGCLWCLKTFLERESYENLIRKNPDLIISCGAGLAPVNYVLSAQSQAKSVSLMRPSVLSTGRFDLVIMPRHDRPPHRNNVAVTEGALNLVDEEYLKEQSEKLRLVVSCQLSVVRIGLLIGGDAKGFTLKKEIMAEVIRQLKQAAQNLDADI